MTTFRCKRCGTCCRWPGQVRLRDGEASEIAAFKALTEFEFIQKYTRLDSERRGLALLDKENGECIFLDGVDCSINPVKPQQCSEFPIHWTNPGSDHACPGQV